MSLVITLPVYDRGMDSFSPAEATAAALRDGELVCIFPEGRLSRDGEIAAFRAGVTRILSEADSLTNAVGRILQAVSEQLDWDLGNLFVVDRGENILRWLETWHGPGAGLAEFAEASRRLVLPPGVGLPGRVWKGRRPAWVPDACRDPNFPRLEVAKRSGVHAALAFPIVVDNTVSQFPGAPIVHHDARACSPKQPRRRGSDAAAGTRHDHHIPHSNPPRIIAGATAHARHAHFSG